MPRIQDDRRPVEHVPMTEESHSDNQVPRISKMSDVVHSAAVTFIRAAHAVVKEALPVTKETAQGWHADNISRLSAALAFYTTFSLAPALVIALAVASEIIGTEAAHSELTRELSSYIGPKVTAFIFNVIEVSQQRITGRTATLISLAASFFGATVVFVELKSAFNIIWKVNELPRGIFAQLVYERIASFVVVLGIGLFLIASMFLSATATAIGEFFASQVPQISASLQWIELFVSFLTTGLLVTLLFKLLPDTPVRWHHAAVGAAFTAVMMMIGKYAIGLYLGRSSLSSIYGAAGSFVIILVWVYYNAQVLFTGAELTHVIGARPTSETYKE
jgi:membrane protein